MPVIGCAAVSSGISCQLFTTQWNSKLPQCVIIAGDEVVSMFSSFQFRPASRLGLASVVFVASSLAQTQGTAPQQPAPTQPTSPGTGSQTPGQGRPGQMPGQQQPFPGRDQQQQQWPDMQQQRTFFFSGKVMLDDGTPPPEPVVIERVCNGVNKPEAYTDTKGRFSFQLGQNQAMMADASVGSSDGIFGGPGMGGRPGMMGNSRGISERDLIGCELRASLAGFRSDAVQLAGRRSLDNPDVGTLVLHRMAKVDGFTFSGTTAFAPKDAQKAYNKGREASKKKKWEDAEKELQKAVTTYPKYATAWFELGLVYHQQQKIEDAKRAYAESIKADEKFVSPYAPLARIAAGEKKWEEAADYSGKLIRLNPYLTSDAYFVSSVANLNLNRLQQAEDHAREALKLDTQNRNPRMHHLLGVILAQQNDLSGAAESMRAYLKLAPDATDSAAVRDQLAKIEQQAGGGERAAQKP